MSVEIFFRILSFCKKIGEGFFIVFGSLGIKTRFDYSFRGIHANDFSGKKFLQRIGRAYNSGNPELSCDNGSV
ncbi:hypothetical protein SDC9_130052 [bioreactor metagenome]|uniref:Uncharacterized protein n=1 Tax=bioreactor metagenome TaxID=1076179 RepID=A0A645D1E4_9ZZZZ